jgi:hypothetical protein
MKTVRKKISRGRQATALLSASVAPHVTTVIRRPILVLVLRPCDWGCIPAIRNSFLLFCVILVDKGFALDWDVLVSAFTVYCLRWASVYILKCSSYPNHQISFSVCATTTTTTTVTIIHVDTNVKVKWTYAAACVLPASYEVDNVLSSSDGDVAATARRTQQQALRYS